MTGYTLSRLAPGSYDVLLNGVIIASLARNGRTSDASWSAELLVDLPPDERPVPFTRLEHRFATLEDARQWLGSPLAGIETDDLAGGLSP
jgi:hypothetical protein